jgi:hypothetical protein
MTTLNNLYLVGLPVTSDTASTNFLNFLVTSGPTIGFAAGVIMDKARMDRINEGVKLKVNPQWDYLVDNNYKFTTTESDIKADEKIVFMKDRWPAGSTGATVAQGIIDDYTVMNAKFPDSKIVFFTISSPNLWNDVDKFLIPQVPPENVIDNPHAPDIAYDLLKDFELIPDLPINVTSAHNIAINPGQANMVGLLANASDAELADFKKIIQDNPDASIFRVFFSYRNEIDQMSPYELLMALQSNRQFFKNAIVSVII